MRFLKKIGFSTFHRMGTICIDHTITEYRICFDQEDHDLGWRISCTSGIKFTYCKTRRIYSASLTNIKTVWVYNSVSIVTIFSKMFYSQFTKYSANIFSKPLLNILTLFCIEHLIYSCVKNFINHNQMYENCNAIHLIKSHT